MEFQIAKGDSSHDATLLYPLRVSTLKELILHPEKLQGNRSQVHQLDICSFFTSFFFFRFVTNLIEWQRITNYQALHIGDWLQPLIGFNYSQILWMEDSHSKIRSVFIRTSLSVYGTQPIDSNYIHKKLYLKLKNRNSKYCRNKDNDEYIDINCRCLLSNRPSPLWWYSVLLRELHRF